MQNGAQAFLHVNAAPGIPVSDEHGKVHSRCCSALDLPKKKASVRENTLSMDERAYGMGVGVTRNLSVLCPPPAVDNAAVPQKKKRSWRAFDRSGLSAMAFCEQQGLWVATFAN